ncbi:MAG TPA: ATP-binding protein [Bryobacteraceae bacterium]|nr:ATP-binding protein [Bryobacteraceae bacterium]
MPVLFRHLFANDFTAFVYSYSANPRVLWLNVISDSLIALSYFLIPFLLLYFARRRRDVPFQGAFVAFTGFVLACGATHVMSALTVWVPVYRVEGVVKSVAALASLAMIVTLIPIMPVLVSICGPSEQERLNKRLAEEIEERRAADELVRRINAELEERVTRRTAELARSESRFRQLAEAMPQMVWTALPNGYVEYFNRQWLEYTGSTMEETGGLQWTSMLHPDDRAPALAQWTHAFHTGGPYEVECRLRRGRDSAYRWFLVRGNPVHDDRGEIVQWLGTCTDIDDQKRSAQHLKHALDDLRLEMEHRHALEDQLIQSQKMEAVGRLAGGVAHDFNNLLTVILGYNEMVREEAREVREGLVEYAEEVRRAAERASALTNQLLAFSRRQVALPRIVDLNELVTNIEKMLRRIIGEDIQLELKLGENLPAVKVDPSHIDQLIMNLVVNSRYAMPEGGKLMLETAGVRLTGEYTGAHLNLEPGTYVMLAVSDTGTGMDAATRARIFEPFFTTKEKGKGTGLGLSIVYGIVKQNGGEILVYSEPNQGTVFKIYLPASLEPAESLAALGSHLETSLGTETILLVEDEDQVRSLTRTMLGRGGYHILDASSPSNALQTVRDFPGRIDLLLTDIVMPRMSGVDLAREILSCRPDVKVLYMSGYTDNGVVNQGVLAPETPFIQKPFTSADLQNKVREVLRSI